PAAPACARRQAGPSGPARSPPSAPRSGTPRYPLAALSHAPTRAALPILRRFPTVSSAPTPKLLHIEPAHSRLTPKERHMCAPTHLGKITIALATAAIAVAPAALAYSGGESSLAAAATVQRVAVAVDGRSPDTRDAAIAAEQQT